jgi:hypothetical protein
MGINGMRYQNIFWFNTSLITRIRLAIYGKRIEAGAGRDRNRRDGTVAQGSEHVD